MNDTTINKFNTITLYELMSEDLDVWVTTNKKFGFDLTLDNEDGETIVDEKGIHPCAADGFADFCRRYLASYDKASQQEAA